jgi:hypothetical protein
MSNKHPQFDDAASRTLFIEELGRAVGGVCSDAGNTAGTGTGNGPLTTQAIGEDGAPPITGVGTGNGAGNGVGNGPLTTFAIGEEGAPPLGGI